MRKLLIWLVMAAGMAMMLTACGGNPVEQAMRDAMVQKDTTQARFDSIASMIKAGKERYKEFLTPEGDIDYAALGALADEVGSRLRPPMHWNIAAYGVRSLSLTVYFERSGSMVPYDTPGGRGQLKKAVNDLINFFPAHDASHVNINIVNDNIYPYQGSIDTFLQDRNIYASTAGMGNASFTDFQKIFNAILTAQRPDNVSVLVTDLIYSPADTKNVSIDKIFNEENSLATSIFKNYKGKSIIVNQLMGDYHGKYYPYNGQPFNFNGQRPFYIIVIADSKVMDAMAANADFKNFMNPNGVRNSYRFNQGGSNVDYAIVPDWKDNAGRFRVAHGKEGTLTNCQGDRNTGVLCFSMAVDMTALHKDDATLCNPANYTVQSLTGFKLAVKPITHDMFTGNNKAYLEGKTHLLTLTGDYKGPRDQIALTLRNELPAWIAQSTATDDTRPSGNAFATTTLGLAPFMQGIYDAFTVGGNYFSLTLTLEN